MEKRRIVRSAVSGCVSLAMIANSTLASVPMMNTVNAVDTVTITPGTDEAKTGTGTMQISLKIKKTPTADDFTFTAPTDLMYDGTPKEVTVTAKEESKGMGAVTVEYYQGETKLDSVPSAAGTYTVKVNTAEGDEYKAGTGISAESWTYTIAPLSKTMTITLSIHGHEFTYSASGAKITADCEGSIGDCDLTSAPELTLVAPAKKKDTDNLSAAATIDGLEAFNTATGKNISAADIEYYSGTTKLNAAPTAEGDYTAKLTVDGATASVAYSIGTTTQSKSMTISLVIKETPNLKVSLENWNFGDTAKTPTVTGNDGKCTVTYTYYKGEEKLEKVPTAVGTYTVKASVPETDTHKAAEATADFTIGKAAIAPEVSIANWTYGEKASEPSVANNPGKGEVTYTYYKGEEKLDGVPTSAGTYRVEASIAETDNYEAGSASKEFTVAKRSLKITADKAGKVYGTDDPALTYSVEGSLVGEDKITGSLSREKGDNTGEYKIGQGSLTAGDNYEVEFVSDKFTITPAAFNISASGYSGAYDGKDHGIVASADVESAKVYYLVSDTEPEEAAFTEGALTESPKYKNAGTYKIWYCITAPNYNTVISYQTVEITKAAIKPSVTLAGWKNGETANKPVVTGNAGNGTVKFEYKVKGAEDS
ncbi:MAG: hypothetical protein IKH71_09715, partial [Oscillospiraceae bacterium]|nr:hypothetical protein [Oscillospiraceae bacterium]